MPEAFHALCSSFLPSHYFTLHCITLHCTSLLMRSDDDLSTPADQDIIDVAGHSWDSLQDCVHEPLKNGWGQGNAEGKTIVDMEDLVCVDCQERLGCFVYSNWRYACERSNFEKILPPTRLENSSLGIGKGYSSTTSAWLTVTL